MSCSDSQLESIQLKAPCVQSSVSTQHLSPTFILFLTFKYLKLSIVWINSSSALHRSQIIPWEVSSIRNGSSIPNAEEMQILQFHVPSIHTSSEVADPTPLSPAFCSSLHQAARTKLILKTFHRPEFIVSNTRCMCFWCLLPSSWQFPYHF